MTKINLFFKNPDFIHFECAKKKFNCGLVYLLVKLILHLFVSGHIDDDPRILGIIANERDMMVYRSESALVRMECNFQLSGFSGFQNRVGGFAAEYIGFIVLDLPDQQFAFTVVADGNRYGFVLGGGAEVNGCLGYVDSRGIALFLFAEPAEILADIRSDGNPVFFHLRLLAFDRYVEEIFLQPPVFYTRGVVGDQYFTLFFRLDNLRIGFHIDMFGHVVERQLNGLVAFVVDCQTAGAVRPVGIEVEE